MDGVEDVGVTLTSTADGGEAEASPSPGVVKPRKKEEPDMRRVALGVVLPECRQRGKALG